MAAHEGALQGLIQRAESDAATRVRPTSSSCQILTVKGQQHFWPAQPAIASKWYLWRVLELYPARATEIVTLASFLLQFVA